MNLSQYSEDHRNTQSLEDLYGERGSHSAMRGFWVMQGMYGSSHAQLSALQLKLFDMTCIAAQVQQRSGSTITHEVAMPDMLSGMRYRAPRPSKHPPYIDDMAALEEITLLQRV